MRWHAALRGQDIDGLRRGLFFGAMLIVVAAGAKAAVAGGWSAGESGHWALRLTMAITGLFIAAVGNAMPKTLPPIASTRCDQSRLQRFMRRAGWTWSVAGLALTAAWLMLPNIAETLTFILMPGAIAIVAVQYAIVRTQRA